MRKNSSLRALLIVLTTLCCLGCVKVYEIEPPSDLIVPSSEMLELWFSKSKPDFIDNEFPYWPYGKEKALCFTWDDGNMLTTKSIASLFNKYHYRTTFYLITHFLSDGPSSLLKEYLFVFDSGHEIGSHTVDHEVLTEISLKDVEYQVAQSSAAINSYFGFFPTTFAHPNRKMNEKIDSIVLKYYLSSRFSSIRDYPRRLIHSIKRVDSFESLKNELDLFMESDDYRWMVYSGHGLSSKYLSSVNSYEPIDSVAFDSFLGYVKQNYDKDVFVAPFEDIIMYELIRDNCFLRFGDGVVFVDTSSIINEMIHYKHPKCLLTIVFDGSDYTFKSNGLVDIFRDNEKTYVTLDLRKGNLLFYE